MGVKVPIVPSKRSRSSSPRDSVDKVRVLDAPATTAPPPETPQRRGGMALAAFAGVMVAALWLTGGAELSGSEEPAAPAALAGSTGAVSVTMPDVTGLTLAEAIEAIRGRGLADIAVDLNVRWRASNRQPEQAILTQSPAPGAALGNPAIIEVVISAGGPVLGFADLPGYVQTFASRLPDFDPGEPVLARATPAGVAYKTDQWLFGECAAVELAYRSFPDAAYLEDCFERDTISIRGVLVDGTAYQVWGLPPAGYQPPSPSGVIVYDDGVTAQALGITTYARDLSNVPPSAVIADGTMEIAAGPWRSRVAIYPDLLESLDEERRLDLAARVHPTAEDGHLVVELEPPLRWQRSGELPSRIAADYGAFRVVAGCITGVENVVCDPSGSVSVEGVRSGFDVAGIAIRLDTAGPEWRQMMDPMIGVEWAVPVAWQTVTERLTSVTFPREVFSTGTYSLRGGGSCADLPGRALADLGPGDVLVTVFVGGADTGAPWPRPFLPELLERSAAAAACADRPELEVQIGSFTLDDVPLSVVVALGSDAEPGSAAAAWRVLDSIDVEPVMWPTR